MKQKNNNGQKVSFQPGAIDAEADLQVCFRSPGIITAVPVMEGHEVAKKPYFMRFKKPLIRYQFQSRMT